MKYSEALIAWDGDSDQMPIRLPQADCEMYCKINTLLKTGGNPHLAPITV